MDNVTVEVHLGEVRSLGSRLKFSLKLGSDGNGQLEIYASDSDGRRSGTLLWLDETGYEELKQMMGRTELTISELRVSGRLRKLCRSLTARL